MVGVEEQRRRTKEVVQLDSVLGIDVGTTSCKAVLFDMRGQSLGSGSSGYPLETGADGAAVQDQATILDAVGSAVRAALEQAGANAKSVATISLSTAMHSIAALDASDDAITPLITFADTRAAPQAERLRASQEGLALYRRTGTPIHAMSPLAKLIWLAETDEATFRRARRFAGLKDLLINALTGVWAVDRSIASSTGMLNLETRDYDENALELTGVGADKLSRLVDTTHVVGELANEAARRFELRAGTPVIAGAADGCLANLGVGILGGGVTAVTIGTSGAVRTTVERPITDGRGRTFCYELTEDLWVIGGPVSSGGIVLRWVRDLLARAEIDAAARGGRDPYEILIDEASEVGPGADGLIFLPFLVGERAPHWNPNASAVLHGLRIDHKRGHVVRAALEGVLYGLRSVGSLLGELTTLEGEVRATGGFLRSQLWRQMLADIFGRPIAIPAAQDASPLGAAVLGMLGVGLLDSIEAINEMVVIEQGETPQSQFSELYEDAYARYLQLFDHVAADFDTNEEFRRNTVTE
jgi:gluconokinase